jgi:hypothetical protein
MSLKDRLGNTRSTLILPADKVLRDEVAVAVIEDVAAAIEVGIPGVAVAGDIGFAGVRVEGDCTIVAVGVTTVVPVVVSGPQLHKIIK